MYTNDISVYLNIYRPVLRPGSDAVSGFRRRLSAIALDVNPNQARPEENQEKDDIDVGHSN
jgi:hypothetical protein